MNFKTLNNYMFGLIIFLIIDLTWVLVVMSDFYDNQLRGFIRPETVPIWSAVIAWLLIPIGIVFFVNEKSKNYPQSIIYGGLYGLIVYGVYGFTNYATLGNWTIKFLFVEVSWGIIVCGISAFLLKIIDKKFLRGL